MKTKAAVLRTPSEKFEIAELDLREPGVGQVFVKLAVAGLCHSDLHVLHGLSKPRFPMVGGHEGSGIVEAVGVGVTKVKPGDHVVLSFIPSCGICRYCSTGRQNMCDMGATILEGSMPDGSFVFHEGDTDFGGMCILGTFSERTTVLENSVVKIDPWIPLDVAALVGCGVPTGWGTAVNAGGVSAGDATIIFGIGGIGINAVQGAVQAGARFVIAVDPVPFKRDMALKFGATHVFDNAKDAIEKTRELTWGQMADQALVTVGQADEQVVSEAYDAVGKSGVVVVTSASDPEAKAVQVSAREMMHYEKTVRGTMFGSCNPQFDIVRLLRMYDSGNLKLDELITNRYTLENINQGYEDLLDGKNIRGIVVFD